MFRSQWQKRSFLFLLLGVIVLGSGCATSDKDLMEMNHQQAATIESLTQELNRLNQELDEMMLSRQELAGAQAVLGEQLKSELASGDMSMSMEDRGLVLTVQNRVLFDSGKATLKTSSRNALNKIAGTLNQKVGGNMVYVEGHTDNEPIRHSGWRSNWELSTARATEVIHYFIEQENVSAKRLAATGYGEFQPVADNNIEAGRMKNRRVEIIISPRKIARAGMA